MLKKQYSKLLLGSIVGAGLGYLYYFFIGCNSGSCSITSNPINSTTYGAFVGLLWMWPTKNKKEKEL